MTNECIFCKIIKKTTPAHIVYEDENSLAFLDLMPRSKGMCLVIPKKHFMNFDDDFDTASKVFDSAMIVGEKIKKALEPLAVFFSIIQGQVPHFHIRVYPVYKEQIPLIENKPIEVSEADLNELAQKIKDISVDWKKEVVEEEEEKVEEEEKPKEKRSEEDLFWMRRGMEIG